MRNGLYVRDKPNNRMRWTVNYVDPEPPDFERPLREVEEPSIAPVGDDALAAKELVERALARIPVRCERILRARYGIGAQFQTLRGLAEAFRVTPERVRQIEAKAMRAMIRKIRRPLPVPPPVGRLHRRVASAGMTDGIC